MPFSCSFCVESPYILHPSERKHLTSSISKRDSGTSSASACDQMIIVLQGRLPITAHHEMMASSSCCVIACSLSLFFEKALRPENVLAQASASLPEGSLHAEAIAVCQSLLHRASCQRASQAGKRCQQRRCYTGTSGPILRPLSHVTSISLAD